MSTPKSNKTENETKIPKIGVDIPLFEYENLGVENFQILIGGRDVHTVSVIVHRPVQPCRLDLDEWVISSPDEMRLLLSGRSNTIDPQGKLIRDRINNRAKEIGLGVLKDNKLYIGVLEKDYGALRAAARKSLQELSKTYPPTERGKGTGPPPKKPTISEEHIIGQILFENPDVDKITEFMWFIYHCNNDEGQRALRKDCPAPPLPETYKSLIDDKLQEPDLRLKGLKISDARRRMMQIITGVYWAEEQKKPPPRTREPSAGEQAYYENAKTDWLTQEFPIVLPEEGKDNPFKSFKEKMIGSLKTLKDQLEAYMVHREEYQNKVASAAAARKAAYELKMEGKPK